MHCLRIVFLATVLVIVSAVVYGNGGPIDLSYFFRTGQVRLLRQSDVQLLTEDLRFRINGDYMWVEATYQLNAGKISGKIPYGFPVDELSSGDETYFNKIAGTPCSDIQFSLNGSACSDLYAWKDTSYSFSISRNHQSLFPSGFYGKGNIGLDRTWHIVELPLLENQVNTLVVRYKVKCMLEDIGVSKMFLPTYTSYRNFSYDLRPAGFWGNGMVQKIKLTLDAQDLVAYEDTAWFSSTKIQRKSATLYEEEYTNVEVNKTLVWGLTFTREGYLLQDLLNKYLLPTNAIAISSRSSTWPSDRTFLIDGETLGAEAIEPVGISRDSLWLNLVPSKKYYVGALVELFPYYAEPDSFPRPHTLKYFDGKPSTDLNYNRGVIGSTRSSGYAVYHNGKAYKARVLFDFGAAYVGTGKLMLHLDYRPVAAPAKAGIPKIIALGMPYEN